MKFTDYIIEPSSTDRNVGDICVIMERFTYEIYGPFGQGYNIKVNSKSSKGILNYHWKEGAYIKTNERAYEIPSKGDVYCSNKKVVNLNKNLHFEPNTDSALTALFVLNHFFSKKTGPFNNKNKV